MVVPGDRVLAIAVEYEEATNDALRALDGGDRQQQLEACIRWGKACDPMSALDPADYTRCGELLLQRGRVPHHAWPRIMAALEAFGAENRAADAEDRQGALSF